MALREILVELGIEVDKNAQKQAEGAVERLNVGLGKLKKLALAAGGIFLTGKLAQGLGKVINDAGAAAEVANKFGAVFIEQADKVGVALDDMAKRTGQSSIVLQKMAADAGALVKPLVGDSEAAAALAETMVEAALDISSFEDVLPEEALGAMRSAIIGSSEPMLRFGVDTRQAALAQFALDKGLKKSTKQMSQAEITALRMELIMKRLGDKGAIGDATKTSGSFTNRLRALDSALLELRVTIGNEFLPVATDMLRVMIDFSREVGPGIASGVRGTLAVLRVFGRVISAVGRAFAFFDTGSFIFIGLAALIIGFKALSASIATSGVFATAMGLKMAAAWIISTIPLIIFVALMGLLIGFILIVIADIQRMGDGHASVVGEMIVGIQGLHDKWGDTGLVIGEMLDTALRFWLEFFGFTREETDLLVEDLFLTLSTFWTNVIDFWKDAFFGFLGTIGDGFKNLASFVLDFVGADELAQTLGEISSGELLLGASKATTTPPGGAAAQALTAGTSGGVGAGPTITSTIEVNVDASSVSDPAVVGDMVAKSVSKANEDEMRQAAQAFAVAPSTS